MKFTFVTFGAKKNLVGSKIARGTDSPRGKTKKPRSLVLLVLANLMPIVGVAFFGWTLFEILYLYWLESVVICLYNIPKVLLAQGSMRERLKEVGACVGIYGLALGGELLGLAGSFGGPGGTMLESSNVTNENFRAVLGHTAIFLPSLITFFVSHSISLYINFIRKKEYLQVTAEEQMGVPLTRVFVTHVVLGLGTILMIKFGSPIPALVILGILKTVFDANAHVQEHTRADVRRKDIPQGLVHK